MAKSCPCDTRFWKVVIWVRSPRERPRVWVSVVRIRAPFSRDIGQGFHNLSWKISSFQAIYQGQIRSTRLLFAVSHVSGHERTADVILDHASWNKASGSVCLWPKARVFFFRFAQTVVIFLRRSQSNISVFVALCIFFSRPNKVAILVTSVHIFPFHATMKSRNEQEPNSK